MRDHAQLLRCDAEGGERAATALAVCDDPVEAAEQPLPGARVARRAAWQKVVGGEDERTARVQQPGIDLRRGEPLEVDEIAVGGCEARERARVAERLRGETAVPGADPRREPVEAVVDGVPGRRGHGSEPKVGREQPDVDTLAHERRRERRIVRRRVGRGVGEHDAHRRPRRSARAEWARAVRVATTHAAAPGFEEARAQFPVLERSRTSTPARSGRSRDRRTRRCSASSSATSTRAEAACRTSRARWSCER